jgi:hypothetical protein
LSSASTKSKAATALPAKAFTFYLQFNTDCQLPPQRKKGEAKVENKSQGKAQRQRRQRQSE